MPKKSLLTILLIIILTGGIAAASVYIGKQLTQPKRGKEEITPEHPLEPQKTVSETTSPEIDISDWNTYRNDEYGFEVKYPRDWIVVKRLKDYVGFSPVKSKEWYSEEGAISINILPNPKKYTLQKFYRFYSLDQNQQLRELDVRKIVYPRYEHSNIIESTTVDEIPSVKFSDVLGEAPVNIISVTYKDIIMEISAHYVSKKDIALFNHVVSTFKFLKRS